MCRVKAKIAQGSCGIEKIAYIKTENGTATEVVLSAHQVGNNHIIAAEVTRDKNKVLVELPRETSSGEWRVWVNKTQII